MMVRQVGGVGCGRGAYLRGFARVALGAALATATVAAEAFCLAPTYEQARRTDGKLLEVEALYMAALQKYPQARSQLLPQAKIDYDWMRSQYKASNLFNGIDLNSTSNSQYMQAQIAQALLNIPAWYDLKRAETFVAATEQKLAATHYDLMLRVATTCFDTMRAREKWISARDEVTALSRMVSDTKRMLGMGLKTVDDVLQHEAKLGVATADENTARAEFEGARKRLEAFTGKRENVDHWPRPKIRLIEPQGLGAGLSVESHPAVRSRAYEMQIAELERKRIAAEHLPVITATGSTTRGLQPALSGLLGSAQSTQNMIGVRISLPLFSGGSTHYREIEAAEIKKQYAARLQQAEDEITREHRETLLALEASATQVDALQRALGALERASAAANKANQSGFKTTYEVLSLRSEASGMRQKLTQAYLDSILLQLRLRQVTSTLDPQALTAIDAYFQPEMPLRSERAPVRAEQVAMRPEQAQARAEQTPVRFEQAPSRVAQAPVRLEPPQVRVEPLPVRAEQPQAPQARAVQPPVRSEPPPVRAELPPVRFEQPQAPQTRAAQVPVRSEPPPIRAELTAASRAASPEPAPPRAEERQRALVAQPSQGSVSESRGETALHDPGLMIPGGRGVDKNLSRLPWLGGPIASAYEANRRTLFTPPGGEAEMAAGEGLKLRTTLSLGSARQPGRRNSGSR